MLSGYRGWMEGLMSVARQLLEEVFPYPGIVRGLDERADLLEAGLNSGDLIKLALRIENSLQVALGPEDLPELSTIAGIERLLGKKRN
jgi:acyl carrier protein